ncbi:hypothetical protein MTR67_024176, partial [Solanum verrucosum]
SPIHSAIRPLVWFIAFQLWPLASSCFESLGDRVLLHETIWRCVDCSHSSQT